jgi:hypothetical protein
MSLLEMVQNISKEPFSLRAKVVEARSFLASLTDEESHEQTKLSFDQFASFLRCFKHVTNERKSFASLTREERAERALIDLLSFRPPIVLIDWWSKTINSVRKVKGHLRCPQRFLFEYLSKLSSLNHRFTPPPPHSVGLGQWNNMFSSLRVQCISVERF